MDSYEGAFGCIYVEKSLAKAAQGNMKLATRPPKDRTCRAVAEGTSTCFDNWLPPQPVAMIIAIRAGIHVYLSYQCSTLNPQKQMKSARRQITTMPTVGLIVLPLVTADSAIPPMTESTTQNPVSVAKFISTKMETKYFLRSS
jgi:hypothetical protein